MITDADIKKLKNSFKDTFTTKDDLIDLRSQISDQIDGKLAASNRNLLDEMDKKLAKQKEDIVVSVNKDIVETIMPLIDEQDAKIAVIQKKVGLSSLDN